MTGKLRSDYVLGVGLITVSAITFSTAGLFTKGVAAGSWEVIFWRAFFAAAFTVAWTAKRQALGTEFRRMGSAGWTVAVIGALGSAAFIPAFKLTTIANVSLIYAASPLLAALLALIMIGERASTRTLLGCVGALAGVLLIVSGSLGSVSLIGDFLALCMTGAMAAIMVLYRKFPDTPVAGPSAMQSILLVPVALAFGAPFQIAPFEILLLAAFGLLFAIASVTLAAGAKLVPSGQTALLSILETPLAPIFAFFLFTEVPSQATILGGSVVMIAVLATMKR